VPWIHAHSLLHPPMHHAFSPTPLKIRSIARCNNALPICCLFRSSTPRLHTFLYFAGQFFHGFAFQHLNWSQQQWYLHDLLIQVPHSAPWSPFWITNNLYMVHLGMSTSWLTTWWLMPWKGKVDMCGSAKTDCDVQSDFLAQGLGVVFVL
jgi:hypothetical protein